MEVRTHWLGGLVAGAITVSALHLASCRLSRFSIGKRRAMTRELGDVPTEVVREWDGSRDPIDPRHRVRCRAPSESEPWRIVATVCFPSCSCSY